MKTIGRAAEGVSVEAYATVNLTEANGWTATLQNVPTHTAGGKAYTYSIMNESAADADALALYTGDLSDTTTLSKGGEATLTLTNELNQQTVDIPVRKDWVDNGGARPEVTLILSNDADSSTQSVTLNGKPYDKSYIDHADIAAGGRMEFVMGNTPNKEWASSKESCPPGLSL